MKINPSLPCINAGTWSRKTASIPYASSCFLSTTLNRMARRE